VAQSIFLVAKFTHMKDKDKNKSGLSKELTDKLNDITANHSPARVSNNLRVVFFDYMRSQEIGLPIDWDDIVEDVNLIFELLEVIAKEKNLK